jgi:hypothetical protein
MVQLFTFFFLYYDDAAVSDENKKIRGLKQMLFLFEM